MKSSSRERWISWNWKIHKSSSMNDICNGNASLDLCMAELELNFSCFFFFSVARIDEREWRRTWMKNARAHIPHLKFKMRANFLMMNLTIWHRSRLNWSIKRFFFFIPFHRRSPLSRSSLAFEFDCVLRLPYKDNNAHSRSTFCREELEPL